jgi:RNA polymerase sigma factor (sigma-70 family)
MKYPTIDRQENHIQQVMSEARSKAASASAIRLAAAAFREYLPDLHAYLVRRMHRGTDVPDLTMEIYERILRNRRPDEIQNPRAYVFRIASNVAREARGLEAQSVVAFDSEVTDDMGRRLAAPDDVMEKIGLTQELQELEQAMAQLPEMHQAVVLLALRDGLSHKEVAQKTGLSVGSVGVYVCEARARLRSILARRREG